MTKIESKTVGLNCPSSEVFDFLSDLNHFEQLLPEDKISKWSSSRENCSFQVQGSISIEFVLKELNPNSEILIESGEKSPFPFQLRIEIREEGENCRVQSIFEAELNPFLKMVAAKPLRNLFDYISDRLREIKG